MERDRNREEERVWESGWEGHERAQRRRLARLSFADKLRWLEEAQEVVTRFGRGGQKPVGAELEPPPGKKPTSGE